LDTPIGVTAIVTKNPDILQPRKLIGGERTGEPRFAKRRQETFVDALADGAFIQQPLDPSVIINAAPEHAAAIQVQESIDEHLGTGVKTRLEGRCAADQVQAFAEALLRLEPLQDLAELGVLLLSQLQSIDHGVAEF